MAKAKVKSPAKATETRVENAEANAQVINEVTPKEETKKKKKKSLVHAKKLATNSNWKEQRGSLTFCVKAVCENDAGFIAEVNKEFGLKLSKTFLKGNNEFMGALVQLRTEREMTFKGFTPWLVMSLIVRFGKAKVEAEK